MLIEPEATVRIREFSLGKFLFDSKRQSWLNIQGDPECTQ